jgi:hypothetical protein
MIEKIQNETYQYFLKERNETNGLLADKSQDDSTASIAATGFGLTCALVGITRGYHSREHAIQKILTSLRFFNSSVQSAAKDATGYNGFYYRYLDFNTGTRTKNSELSTIDNALLMAGILSVGEFFTGDHPDEIEIRDLSKKLYERVDWKWACDGQDTLTHGWTPEKGFIPVRWNQGYCEAMILYFLALGSPTHATDPKGYEEWTSTFEFKEAFNIKYIYAGPLFIHQYTHLWVDFRGIHDAQNTKYNFDYFENSKRATYVHQHYAIENPMKFEGYGEKSWGFTASDGPGESVKTIDGREQVFYGYIARGAPYGPDDGTISPWAAATSLPFAPEIVLPTLEHSIHKLHLDSKDKYGFESSYNCTVNKDKPEDARWVSPHNFGINHGPLVIMTENYLSQMIWKLMKNCSPLQNGIKRAGFISLN